jgi:hypothetical protein
MSAPGPKIKEIGVKLDHAAGPGLLVILFAAGFLGAFAIISHKRPGQWRIDRCSLDLVGCQVLAFDRGP